MGTRGQSKPGAIAKFKVDGREAITAEQEHQLREQNRELRRQLDEALRSRVLDRNYEQFVTRALSARINPPAWAMTPRTDKKHIVMPTANFSDWHLDEEVRPEEISNKNGYNREIARKRLKYYFENVCKVAHSYMRGFEYPGIVFNMLGDNFSGFIHDELRRTNSATMMESLVYWLGPLKAGLLQLADSFGHVWVTGVVGNHGRHDKKPIAKMRAFENFDWLFMQLLKEFLKDDPRIHFTISNGQKLQFSIFDLRVITSHGDEAKGGSGIAGMLSPLLIAMSRMKKNYEFDQWWIGHWHYRADFRGIRVNGTGKGYDEYAALNNFDYQTPMQDFFLVAPGRGVVASWPIYCQTPDEPWANKPQNKPPFSA
jgi:hypothetical protein